MADLVNPQQSVGDGEGTSTLTYCSPVLGLNYDTEYPQQNSIPPSGVDPEWLSSHEGKDDPQKFDFGLEALMEQRFKELLQEAHNKVISDIAPLIKRMNESVMYWRNKLVEERSAHADCDKKSVTTEMSLRSSYLELVMENRQLREIAKIHGYAIPGGRQEREYYPQFEQGNNYATNDSRGTKRRMELDIGEEHGVKLCKLMEPLRPLESVTEAE
ncbi:hypothetical protein GP486_001939 [Trichoglossum hirsutum]|uniref:Uncharacterized protein n=1 Tax=Trichoglossum hirsutum TaxID=265104 RepID=A0A9P8LFW5_9PEZI|nr:hypothetical protein GP486_001939 [Trichoglossum hirsutum]